MHAALQSEPLHAATVVKPRGKLRALPPAAPAEPELSLLDLIPTSKTEMPVGQFIALRECPRQRDTEKHAEFAKKRHLSKASPVHKDVRVALLNGVYHKLDGHTRALLWSRGELQAPARVDVTIYHCRTIEDMKELYSHFDNKGAVETTADILSGAMRENAVAVTSPAMRKYGFSTALQIASRCFGVAEERSAYKNVAEFAEELALLDSINPSASLFRVGVMAGAIIMLRRHGRSILPFFELLNANAGIKDAHSCDAVQALSDIIKTPSKKSDGFSSNLNLAEKTISCVERFRKGETYMNSARGVSVKRTGLAGYLEGRKKLV